LKPGCNNKYILNVKMKKKVKFYNKNLREKECGKRCQIYVYGLKKRLVWVFLE